MRRMLKQQLENLPGTQPLTALLQSPAKDPDLASLVQGWQLPNEGTGCPVTCELQINDEWIFGRSIPPEKTCQAALGHTCPEKLLVVHLKFAFHQAPYIFSGSLL